MVLLNGGGFDGPQWSVRVSLADLDDLDHLKIGHHLRRIFNGYAAERERATALRLTHPRTPPADPPRARRAGRGGVGGGRLSCPVREPERGQAPTGTYQFRRPAVAYRPRTGRCEVRPSQGPPSG
ncbi:hypothetical protein ACFWSF_09730 [Streptomyces sp. NPDC058611]|uniref:hypothetical protein n=1 Tax=unclassified Streptomyces TaxID=2593676 RepID=UPI00364BF589